MDKKTMQEFVDIYNAANTLLQQGYINREIFQNLMCELAYNCCGRMAILLNKAEEV